MTSIDSTSHELEIMERHPDHQCLIIKIKDGERIDASRGLYNTVRQEWKLDIDRARKVYYVLAVINGVCEGVFRADWWYTSEKDDKRIAFHGRQVFGEISRRYVGKRIPTEMRESGMQNPCLYWPR